MTFDTLVNAFIVTIGLCTKWENVKFIEEIQMKIFDSTTLVYDWHK